MIKVRVPLSFSLFSYSKAVAVYKLTHIHNICRYNNDNTILTCVQVSSAGGGRLRHSGSSYSVTSVSSGGSGRSVRSTGSNRSNSSWFSIDSLSSFQVSSFDRGLPQPRVRDFFFKRSFPIHSSTRNL